MSRPLRKRPKAMVGIVVPLPSEGQSTARVIEVVARHPIERQGVLRQGHHHLLGRLAAHTYERPTILPGDGENVGNPPHRVAVLNERGVPVAAWCVHDGPLGDALVVVAHEIGRASCRERLWMEGTA